MLSRSAIEDEGSRWKTSMRSDRMEMPSLPTRCASIPGERVNPKNQIHSIERHKNSHQIFFRKLQIISKRKVTLGLKIPAISNMPEYCVVYEEEEKALATNPGSE